MKAMILAAGRGSRLRPLTDNVPKALIEVQGTPLIVHHIQRLVDNNVSDIVVNLAHLGPQIKHCLGNGQQFGVNITYSEEPVGGYETGGGIVNALPLLGDKPFLVVNSDIFCSFDFTRLPALDKQLAHLVLVANPAHNQKGDYSLQGHLLNVQQTHNNYTYSGIAVYDPKLFEACTLSRYSVTPLIKQAAKNQLVTGECFGGTWHDIGTVDRLRAAQKTIN